MPQESADRGTQAGSAPENPIVCLGTIQEDVIAVYTVAKERGHVWATINHNLFRIASNGTCELYEISGAIIKKIDVAGLDYMDIRNGNFTVVKALLDRIEDKPLLSLEELKSRLEEMHTEYLRLREERISAGTIDDFNDPKGQEMTRLEMNAIGLAEDYADMGGPDLLKEIFTKK